LLSIITKTLPLGIVYAVWSGVGIVLTTLVAMFVFGQKPDLPSIIGMALIIGGVLVINLFSNYS
jgi:drug resistance protein